MSNPAAVMDDNAVGEAIQSAVELAAGVAAVAGVPPFDVAAAVGGTGTGAEDDTTDNGDGGGALAAAASAAQAADAGAPAKKRRKTTGRKKENPDDVSLYDRIFASCFVCTFLSCICTFFILVGATCVSCCSDHHH